MLTLPLLGVEEVGVAAVAARQLPQIAGLVEVVALAVAVGREGVSEVLLRRLRAGRDDCCWRGRASSLVMEGGAPAAVGVGGGSTTAEAPGGRYLGPWSDGGGLVVPTDEEAVVPF